MPEKKSSNMAAWLIVAAAVGVGVIALLGVLAALAIHGMRKYLVAAKTGEGMSGVAQLARGIQACAEHERLDPDGVARRAGLPPSSAPVPRSLAMVSGRKYQSAAADWSGPTFSCAGFSMRSPQYFQYQWQLDTAGAGRAIARADLDGDGRAEVVLEAPVSCGAAGCTVGPMARR